MADIKNHTLNFGAGRALCALDFAAAKSAFTEVQRNLCMREAVANG